MSCCVTIAFAPRHPPPAPWQLSDLRRGDTATVQRVFDGLSARSRYLRFHVGQPSLPRRSLHLLAQVEPGRHAVHVARIGDEPVGLVRWIRLADEPGHAEVAIEVVDRAQGQGVGRALLARAAASAATASIHTFVAYVTAGNRAVRTLALASGAQIDREDSDTLRLPVAGLLAAPSGGGPLRQRS